MLEEEKYNKLIKSLSSHIEHCSDTVNAEVYPYESYFTKTQKWDCRKTGFKVRVIIVSSHLSADKIISIYSDVFEKLKTWIDQWKQQVYFSNFIMNSVGGGSARTEIDIYFDDMVESVKRMLLR